MACRTVSMVDNRSTKHPIAFHIARALRFRVVLASGLRAHSLLRMRRALRTSMPMMMNIVAISTGLRRVRPHPRQSVAEQMRTWSKSACSSWRLESFQTFHVVPDFPHALTAHSGESTMHLAFHRALWLCIPCCRPRHVASGREPCFNLCRSCDPGPHSSMRRAIGLVIGTFC